MGPDRPKPQRLRWGFDARLCSRRRQIGCGRSNAPPDLATLIDRSLVALERGRALGLRRFRSVAARGVIAVLDLLHPPLPMILPCLAAPGCVGPIASRFRLLLAHERSSCAVPWGYTSSPRGRLTESGLRPRTLPMCVRCGMPCVPERAVSGHTARTSMFPDPARRSPHSARIGVVFTVAAIAVVLLCCSPPRNGSPPTPQTTIAVRVE